MLLLLRVLVTALLFRKEATTKGQKRNKAPYEKLIKAKKDCMYFFSILWQLFVQTFLAFLSSVLFCLNCNTESLFLGVKSQSRRAHTQILNDNDIHKFLNRTTRTT